MHLFDDGGCPNVRGNHKSHSNASDGGNKCGNGERNKGRRAGAQSVLYRG